GRRACAVLRPASGRHRPRRRVERPEGPGPMAWTGDARSPASCAGAGLAQECLRRHPPRRPLGEGRPPRRRHPVRRPGRPRAGSPPRPERGRGPPCHDASYLIILNNDSIIVHNRFLPDGTIAMQRTLSCFTNCYGAAGVWTAVELIGAAGLDHLELAL